MEKNRSSAKNSGPTTAPPDKSAPPHEDTKVARDTEMSPDEHDPAWENLGSTQVVDGIGARSLDDLALDSPSQHTPISASRVLGKDLVRLGDFQLVRKLGEGAMGAVYKAQQVAFNGEKLDTPRTVALKVLFPHVAKIKKLVDRLYREGLTMGRLDHPNIVQAYAVNQAEGCHYVAMEYVPGQSMQKWLNQLGRLPVGDAVKVALDCARALAYAHRQPMVHRDIKPDNILLTKNGIVKIADFGMVKAEDDEMALTQTGHAVGTPWFMPLEQARNAKEIDGRSDIYALGCTLYALLTGQPPFMGPTIVDVIQSKEIGTFPPARQVNSDVPERLDLIIAKMTAKLPKYRYQSCDDLIKDLESLGLANDTLSFIYQRPATQPHAQETPVPGKTAIISQLLKSKPDIDFAESAAATHDPNLWYVQYQDAEGKITVRKYDTATLQDMLEEGTMKPTMRVSHNPNDGFRAIGTFKEFQGVALSKTAKKKADKNTARYRGLYKRIEDEDKERAEKERAENTPESATTANTRYWLGIAAKVVPVVIAAVAVIALLSWLASR